MGAGSVAWVRDSGPYRDELSGEDPERNGQSERQLALALSGESEERVQNELDELGLSLE